ncbi:MAG: glycosyl transferase group 1 [Chloroflexi bacterium]|nr:glycosyl transferase group 1 [Chloroflexota bacterium]
MQHARGTTPDPDFGYCTDDVARALGVDLLHGRELGWPVVSQGAWRSLGFLEEALEPATGRFRNFRRTDGAWLDEAGSEDSHGRAMLGLGEAIADAPDALLVERATVLFSRALPAAVSLTALRATASVLLGCDAALRGGLDGDTRRAFELLAARLRTAFDGPAVTTVWPWPEPVLTYENALLPRALIVAGRRLGDDAMLVSGLRTLNWLIRVQATSAGCFSPIGNRGWWPRGGTIARFDQQPIEATALLLAAETAWGATGDGRYQQAAEMAYAWFLGGNELGLSVAVPATGGCGDGLTPHGVNLNQGAESTLMWLTALETTRRLRSDDPAAVGQSVRTPALGASSPWSGAAVRP